MTIVNILIFIEMIYKHEMINKVVLM